MKSRPLHVSTGLPTLLTACSIAVAQTLPPPEDERPLEEITVLGVPLGRTADELAAPITILSGEELIRRRRATLGDTLDGRPGIHSDTFGAGASRPVIRGQTAPRVGFYSNSSEVMDASAVSPDHVVSAEPLLLERIEVLRGPSTLLYGGTAIGGAVNLIDRRVPTVAPANGLEGAFEVRGGSADDERSGAAGLTGGTGNVAFRLEAAARRTDDYRVPGREERRVEGSYNDTSSLGLGLSWVGANGFLGASYSRQRSEYGLPGHSHEYEDCHPHGTQLHCEAHGHDHGHEHGHDDDHDEVPVVDLRSDRFDLRGDYYAPIEGIENIRIRAGFTDYEHDEIDDDVVATTFKNRGYDARFELEHSPIGAWHGVAGVQMGRSRFSALGLESFVPETTTRMLGVFLLEEYRADDWRVELAIRQERQEIDAEAPHPWAKHRSFSASGGLTWAPVPDLVVGLSLARSQRAPTPQELYAEGIHLATNTYEIGDPTLKQETSKFVDLSLRRVLDPFTFSISFYRNEVTNYIFAQTLDRFEDFRLIRYSQRDAHFAGVDAEASYRFADRFKVSVYGDYIRGQLAREAENLPRIPAGRLGTRLEGRWESFSADLDYYHVFEQADISAFETVTPSYEMVNATFAYDLGDGRFNGQLYLRGTNLLNEEALNHTSFIKNAAPLMGRNVVIGFRAGF
jgi:iron complex outermembrane recepter protein